ncbi:MAG: sulfite exporter TauE/SafE family protein, partial [Cyanobacteria bacterium J06600_6]
IVALIMMLPAALTSSDRLQQKLGSRWRKIHLLTVPAFILVVGHTVLLGSHYLGDLQGGADSKIRVASVIGLSLVILLCRSSWFWRIIGLRKSYVSAKK